MKNQLKNFNAPEGTFINGWYASDKIVNTLIDFYNTNNNKNEGTIWDGAKNKLLIDRDRKDSLEVTHFPKDWQQNTRLHPYFKFLNQCINAYAEKYTFIKKCDMFGLKFGFNIQKYKPGGGYKEWHFERASKGNTSSRVLVFMTYLNDVEDGGTEFYYQKYTAPAEKGLTLIWPAEWTHTHRGIVSNTKEKMIATGWFNYINVDYDK